MTNPEHHPEVDALRVLAFIVLVPLHAAIPFIPGGMPQIQSEQTSALLNLWVTWLHEFRLPLLFLVAGMSLLWSWRKRGIAGLLRERSQRLLIPLTFGVLVVVPPMVYLEKRFMGTAETGLLRFYGQLLTGGLYPSGSLSWHHYWFIAYLFLFMIASLPVLLFARGGRGPVSPDPAKSPVLLRFGIMLMVLPLFTGEWLLRRHFPGFPDVVHDWANILLWFQIFLFGMAMASYPVLFELVSRLRLVTLVLAIDLGGMLYLLFVAAPLSLGAMSDAEYLLFCLLRVAHIWCWILAIVGFAIRHLSRRNRLFPYLNQAVYPLFCLHLPVIVAASYVLIGSAWPLWSKHLLISLMGLVIPLLIYEGLLKRSAWLGALFGLPRPTCPHQATAARSST